METPLFFKNKDYRLFGVLHEPESGKVNENHNSERQSIGLAFCHPFAEEKLISHRVLVNLARGLAKQNIYCLRFDYMGHGDSDGRFEESTIQTRISDIHCAVKYLGKARDVKKVGLLGVRLGGTLAALAWRDGLGVNTLILISPVVNGKVYIDQCLRSNLTTQLTLYKKVIKDRQELIKDLLEDRTVNIDGYVLTGCLYNEIAAIDLSTVSRAPENVMIIQISRRENENVKEEINELHVKYRANSERTELLNMRGEYFWMDSKVYNPAIGSLRENIVKFLLTGIY